MVKDKKLLKDLSIQEVSMVTSPANPDAHVMLFKTVEESDVAKGKFNDVLDAVELEDQIREMMRPMWDYSEALQTSFRSVLIDEKIKDKIAALKGCVAEFADRLKKEISQIELSTNKSAEENHGGKLNKEEVAMSEEKTYDQTTVNKMVSEAVEKALEESGVEELKILSKMTDVEREYLEGLEGDTRADFLKMSSEDRAAFIRKVQESDEILETPDGVIRKSEVGAAVFGVMKSTQERLEAAEKKSFAMEQAASLQENIQKAEEAWPHLGGSAEVKGSVMREIQKMPESERDALLQMLKQSEDTVIPLFASQGTSAVPAPGSDNPVVKLEELAKSFAKDNNVSYPEAYAKVMETSEGKELYYESQRKTG